MTIIEISGQNANFKTLDNNIYNITLEPPIQGGQNLNLKNAFLDLRDLGNSNNDSFIINVEVKCILEFSYYEQFNSQHGQESLLDGTKPPITNLDYANKYFVPYIFTYKQEGQGTRKIEASKDTQFDTIEILKGGIEFNIPPGAYTSDSIVEFINDKLQRYNRDKNMFTKEGIAYPFTATQTYIRFQDIVDQYITMFPKGSPTDYFSFIGFVRIDQDPILIDPSASEFIGYFYPQVPESSGISNYEALTASLFLGTPEFNLQNVDNKLSFQYLHNPIYDIVLDTNNNVQSKTEVFTFTKNVGTEIITNLQLVRGGINIISLEPSNFWSEILGFTNTTPLTIERIELPITYENAPSTTLIDLITLDEFITSTTRPFVSLTNFDIFTDVVAGISNNTDFDNGLTKLPGAPITVVNTVPLTADRVINFADTASGGHFQLEIETGFKINNYKDSKTVRSLSAIMSREYLNDGFLSILGGSVNIPIPSNASISSITIFIKDPITRQLVQNIGVNNTFYFEID